MKKKKIKRSPFTLAQTWKYCLVMWKWVADKYEDEKTWEDVESLKTQWMKENGFRLKHTISNCFFCDYSNRQKDASCEVSCPGAMVSPRFSCCHSAYDYSYKPKKFYQKLLRMNRKRCGNK